MPAQGFDELFEWFDATSHRSVAPVFQVLPGMLGALVFPEHIEGFLDAVRPHRLEIIGQEVLESGPLPNGQVLRALEETIARFAQDRIVALVVKSLGFLTAGFIHRFIEFLDDVKPIQDVQGKGEHFSDDFEVVRPHVRAGNGDGGTSLGTEKFEPCCQGAFLASLDDAQKAS